MVTKDDGDNQYDTTNRVMSMGIGGEVGVQGGSRGCRCCVEAVHVTLHCQCHSTVVDGVQWTRNRSVRRACTSSKEQLNTASLALQFASQTCNHANAK